MSICDACRTELVDGWAHCQGCGAPTAAAATDVPETRVTQSPPSDEVGPGDEVGVGVLRDPNGAGSDSTLVLAADTETIAESEAEPAADEPEGSPRSFLTKRRVLVALASATALAVVVVTALNIVGTHDRLDKTRTELASTQADLDETRGALKRTQNNLDRTETDLQTRTSERDTLRSDLASTQQQLTAANANLVDARGKVDLQASVIEDLRYCLSGVADAALYLADGYYGAAIDSLDAVVPACRRAGESVV